jgi:hypothetical protein
MHRPPVGEQGAMSCSEDAELRRGHQPLCGTEASFGGFDGVLDLVGGDGVVVAWIGVLGLVFGVGGVGRWT